MQYRNDDPMALLAMETDRLGEYGDYNEKEFTKCAVCLDSIYYGENYYSFPDDVAVCEYCVKDFVNEHFCKIARNDEN